MKAKITTAANIPAATRRAVYRRDGYRCALCDDVRGLQFTTPCRALSAARMKR